MIKNMSYQKCPLCKGKGLIKNESCFVCNGERIINKESGLPPSRNIPISVYPIQPFYPYYPSYPVYPITYSGGTEMQQTLLLNTSITN